MRALCLIREAVHYRRDAFCTGLRAAGFELVSVLDKPKPDDVLVIWNRYGRFDAAARRFEAAGARVIVAENGYLGKDWRGETWYSLALNHHAGAGRWREGGPERWDSLGVELAPWRTAGTETLVLGQRGIGEPGIASPPRWAEQTQKRIGGRIRAHPGVKDARPLEHDLANARCVATWASGAALKALLAGVPVWYAMPKWIGAGACGRLQEFNSQPVHGDRLAMFRRLAWAIWRLEEIRTGEAFRWLLG